MSSPPNTKQASASTTNDLPPHLYWIPISTAVATLLPAIYVAYLTLKPGILSPDMRYFQNLFPIHPNPDTQDEKWTEEELRTVNHEVTGEISEDETFGLEAEDYSWVIVDHEGKGDGIRRTLLTRTRCA